jgi:hypothetical protein
MARMNKNKSSFKDFLKLSDENLSAKLSDTITQQDQKRRARDNLKDIKEVADESTPMFGQQQNRVSD